MQYIQGGAEAATEGIRRLHLDDRGNSNEAFMLRHLHQFKGDYDGDAISEWLEKVDMLKDLCGLGDQETIRVLPLRMTTRVADYLRGLLNSLERSRGKT